MIEVAQIGRRIREARERRGLSQQSVADTLGIPRTAVTNVEAGIRNISTLELTRLALLLNQPASMFLEGKPVSDLAVVRARAVDGFSTSPEFGLTIDRMLDLCREGAELRRLLDQETTASLPNYAQRLTTAGDAIRQGEAKAREERRRLGLGNAPLGDMAELISEQGIWVSSAADEFPPNVSGLFLNHATIGLAILINGSHNAERRRFSYGHEYAHALFDQQEELRLTQGGNAHELIEKRANAFAAGFLMPAGGVLDQLRRLDKGLPSRQSQIVYSVATDSSDEAEIRPRSGSQVITFQDIAALARHFGVSYEAMVWRLRNLDHLDMPSTSALIDRREDGRRYVSLLRLSNPSETGAAPQEERERELRGQLAHLAIECYRREEISQGRLREIGRKIGLRASELLELAEAAKLV